MSVELKPCPFCGGKAILTSETTNYFSERYFVLCNDCHNRTKGCQFRRTAIEAWNRRAET